jgi:hypothetical protein
MAIAVLSFSAWLHHFFMMGQNANVRAAVGNQVHNSAFLVTHIHILAIPGTLIAQGLARNTIRIVRANQVRTEHRRWIDTLAAARSILRTCELQSVMQMAHQGFPCGI